MLDPPAEPLVHGRAFALVSVDLGGVFVFEPRLLSPVLPCGLLLLLIGNAAPLALCPHLALHTLVVPLLDGVVCLSRILGIDLAWRHIHLGHKHIMIIPQIHPLVVQPRCNTAVPRHAGVGVDGLLILPHPSRVLSLQIGKQLARIRPLVIAKAKHIHELIVAIQGTAQSANVAHAPRLVLVVVLVCLEYLNHVPSTLLEHGLLSVRQPKDALRIGGRVVHPPVKLALIEHHLLGDLLKARLDQRFKSRIKAKERQISHRSHVMRRSMPLVQRVVFEEGVSQLILAVKHERLIPLPDASSVGQKHIHDVVSP